MKAYLTITIIILCTMIGFGQSVYDYPIRGGTDQWRELKNHAEKVSVCQIPDTILTKLNTKELLNACLDYPLLGDIMAFQNSQDGMDAYKRNFNGINEFYNRPDHFEAIKEKYSGIEPADIHEEWTLFEKGEFVFKTMALELIISQDEVLSNLDTNQKKDLVKILLEKKNSKFNKEVYTSDSHMTIYLLITRILLTENVSFNLSEQENYDLEVFSHKGNLNFIQLSPKIYEVALNYIK